MKRHGGVDADDLGAWPRTYHFGRASGCPMDGRDLMISEGKMGDGSRAGNSPRMRPLSAPSLQSICSGARHLRIVVKWRLLVIIIIDFMKLAGLAGPRDTLGDYGFSN